MRWDELTVEQDRAGRLPGFRDPPVIRTFDAPEALDTRFYEVRARSALNKVPAKSRMPFPWTINPYRGCTHACVWCLSGATPILMGDGRHKPLSEVRVGETVYGTVREGAYRRYVPTEVLDKWSTRKPAYRVTLEDGTELVASGDHRFLTARGWKHVVGTGWGGRLQRPHLTLNDKLMGIGSFAEPPAHSGAHKRGLRFCHTVDPAITRRRSPAGQAIKSKAPLGVESIECLDLMLPMYDITTGTGDFIANGVVSHNCFARPTHKYLDFNAGRDFEKEIVVKVNVPELLRAELARPSWKGEHVALGTNTDPYQWVEGRYKLLPGIWEAFRDFANPCSVLTKSPLVLRDLPLLRQVAERAPVTANFSVPTLDEKAWRASEPHTPHPRARLEAIAELTKAGIPTGILIAPLMPGINDSPEQVEKIVEIATEAGAVSIGGIALHLRGEVREITFDWLRSYRPDLVPVYEEIYRRGAYASKAVQNEIGDRVSAAKRKSRFVARRPARGTEPRAVQEHEKDPAQTSLF